MTLKLSHPKLRFDSGFEPYINKRQPDTRTADELKASIRAWANSISEAKQILPSLDSMRPKLLGLVADTLELSQKNLKYQSEVNMMKGDTNINPLEALMAQLPVASKKNPNSIDFAKQVIDRAGLTTSKFFLKDSAEKGFLIADGVDRNFDKAVSLVDELVKVTVNAPINGREPIERQKDFMKALSIILDKKTDVEKIEYLEPILNTIGNTINIFKMDKFLQNNKTPRKNIDLNVWTLSSEAHKAYSYGKALDVNAHLAQDPFINFVKADLGGNKLWD